MCEGVSARLDATYSVTPPAKVLRTIYSDKYVDQTAQSPFTIFAYLAKGPIYFELAYQIGKHAVSKISFASVLT